MSYGKYIIYKKSNRMRIVTMNDIRKDNEVQKS